MSRTPEQAKTVECMDSWAQAQGLATYSELLDALMLCELRLKNIARDGSPSDNTIKRASAAIAKATGDQQ